MSGFHFLSAGACLASILIPYAFAGPTYTCTTFTYGAGLSVSAINNKGEVVGVWSDAKGAGHTYLRKPDGTMKTLTSPTGDAFGPIGINNLGQVAGPWFILNPDGTYINIAPPVAPPGHTHRFSGMTGINDKGEVSGWIDGDYGNSEFGGDYTIWAFIRGTDGHYRIAYADGSGSSPYLFIGPLNNSGTVVVRTRYTNGFLVLSDGSQIRLEYPGFNYDSGSPTGGDVWTMGLNNNNTAVGRVVVDYGGPYPAQVRTADEQYWTVGCQQLMDFTLAPTGINDYNAVVGNLDYGPAVGFIATPTGERPHVEVSEKDWSFGSHIVGDASGSGIVFISNPGPVDLHIPTVWVGGSWQSTDHPKSFQVINTDCTNSADPKLPKTIPPGSSCFVEFRFVPEVSGWQTATIYVSNDSPDNSPLMIHVGGTGVESTLRLSNTTGHFAAHPVGETSGNGVIYIYNTGPAAIMFKSIQISDPGPGSNFNLLNDTCSASLAPYKDCALTFNFTPQSPGSHRASLNLTDNSGQHAIHIPLFGYAPQ